MPSSVTEIPTIEKRAALDEEQLDQLARTYDNASQPVWVHNLSTECVYKNPPALENAPHNGPVLDFEIIDHHDQPIGYLTTSRP